MKKYISLKWQIIKKVIIVHGLIAILLTGLQLKFDYDDNLDLIKKNLTSSYDMFGPPLSQAFYNANLPMLEEIFQGILSQKDFIGVAIYDNISKEFILRGDIQIDNQSLLKYISNKPLLFELKNDSNIIAYQHPIKILIKESEKRYFGNLIVFSTAEIAFERTVNTMYIVFFNSIIKAIVLLSMFILIFNRTLIDPLNKINNILSHLSSQNIKSLRLDLNTSKSHELYTFQKQFNKLLDELYHAQEQERLLQYKSKCIAIGEVMGNIAHQWRQPLATVNMIIAIILEKSELELLGKDELRAKLKEIEKQNHYMSETINGFLNFFEPTKKIETHNLAKLIRSTIDILKNKIENNEIEVLLDINKNIEVPVNKQDFTQLLIILFSNAIDSISEKNSLENRKIIVSVIQNEKTTIVIKDYGIGISQENEDRVFEPYFTTKHSSQGVGLGLYIAKNIIEKSLNGTITITNHKDGAVSTLTF